MSEEAAVTDARAVGFTLLEVLAALAILGLILAALSEGVRFGQQALLIQARAREVANQVSPVDATLRSLIGRAWPGAVGLSLIHI